ncbi:MAG TPA: pitrilysin family protein [Gemmatimonadales bacterium]|nr:pitrilysin family protein [Gemmatimonadales bacterium]
MRVVRVFRLLALLAGAVPAAPVAAQQVVGAVALDSFRLANGLQVIYAEQHSTPVVTVDLWYRVGARNERPKLSGFAHLFEHMMFQGSAHVGKAEHFKFVERAGGEENGSTHDDYTNYYETLPSNRLNLALWLEADRMRSLAVTQQNLENQRQAVEEEKRLRVDNQPYAGAFRASLIWPYDSTNCFAYAHPGIGVIEDLDSAKLADVRAFHDTYYAPNNTTLVIAGDFQPTELKRLVTAYFSDIPSKPAPAAVTCNFKLSPGIVARAVADSHATLPAVIRVYRIPAAADGDTPALDLLNSILGQGESSRLNVEVVRRDTAALQASSFSVNERRGPGSLLVLGIANRGVSAGRLDSLLAAQIETIRSSGVTADELTRAKNQYRAGVIQGRETTFGIAEAINYYSLLFPSVSDMNTDPQRYLAVTADDIKRVATKYLDPANATVVTVNPAGKQQSGGAQ